MSSSVKIRLMIVSLVGLALACATTTTDSPPDLEAAVQETLAAQTAEASGVQETLVAQTAVAQPAVTSVPATSAPAATSVPATSAPAATATLEAVLGDPPEMPDGVYLEMTVDLPPTWSLDLDTGEVGTDIGADLYYNAVAADENYFEPWQPFIYFAYWIPPANFEPPTLASCSEQTFSEDPIRIEGGLTLGDYVCFITDEGRTGVMLLADVYLVDGTDDSFGITLDLIVWETNNQ